MVSCGCIIRALERQECIPGTLICCLVFSLFWLLVVVFLV